jgi:hypothetical protein
MHLPNSVVARLEAARRSCVVAHHPLGLCKKIAML